MRSIPHIYHDYLNVVPRVSVSRRTTYVMTNELQLDIYVSIHVLTQWPHHGQTTLKQRCIDVTEVDTTLFLRRLTHDMPAGKSFVTEPIKIEKGAPQGSSILFNLCFNILLKTIYGEQIMLFNEHFTNKHWLQFVDYTAIVTSS